MNRRTFIESSLAAAAVTSLPFRGLAAAHQVDPIGVELYTVRDLMKTDVPGTLAKIAAIGYKEVEFAGYFDHSPKDLRAILDKDGLTAPACHVSYAVVQNKWPEAIEAGHILATNAPSSSSIKPAKPAARRGSSLAITTTSGSFSPTRVSATNCPTTSCLNPPSPRT